MNIRCVIVTCLLVAMDRPAAALLTTDQLQGICVAGLQNPSIENPKYAFCMGLVLGVLNADGLEKNLICVPPDLDTKTALKVFIARASAEPKKGTEGLLTLFRALAEKYPCR